MHGTFLLLAEEMDGVEIQSGAGLSAEQGTNSAGGLLISIWRTVAVSDPDLSPAGRHGAEIG
jgi:hypothetical protein